MAEVLYFSTTTCGPCKMFKPIVQEVQRDLGVPVQYIDAQVNSDLAVQYGVYAVPTLVIKNGSTVLHKSLGVMSKPQLTNLLSQFK